MISLPEGREEIRWYFFFASPRLCGENLITFSYSQSQTVQ